MLDELNISLEELREDLDVLNVVNFGGGTYVLYAEIAGDEIEVDPDTYGDNFARPARLLPLEAKALVAAIDLFGDHLPQAGLQTAPAGRSSTRSATTPPRRGSRSPPAATTPRSCATVNDAIQPPPGARAPATTRRTRTSSSSARSSRTSWSSGPEGWYLGCFDLGRGDDPPLPPRPDEGGGDRPSASSSPARASRRRSPSRSGWSAARSTTAGVARVWVSPDRARWLREERTVVEELSDGAVVVELPYGSDDWLVREVLKGVGDLVVLEPDDAREAVLKAVAG